MLRLHADQLSSNWFDVVRSLFADIDVLGHHLTLDNNSIVLNSSVPATRSGPRAKQFWRPAHEKLHQINLEKDAGWIREFDRRYEKIFVDGSRLSIDSIAPSIEAVDPANETHRDIVSYLHKYQTVASRKLVGRRFGLLIFDQGQAASRPLIGGALLCSARYSQPARDQYFKWPSSQKKRVRGRGLDRIMQLAVVCALPPYSRLAGAWLLAASPFTSTAQAAYQAAAPRLKDPDLAAIVTTSGFDLNGSPFQRHQVSRLLGGGYGAHRLEGGGEIYTRLDSPRPLRARFEALVSRETYVGLRKLHQEEEPGFVHKVQAAIVQRARMARGSRRRIAIHTTKVLEESLDRAALAFMLRRLGMHRSLFDGNDMGVHVGALGIDTINALRTGVARTERPTLEWEILVREWRRKFTAEGGVSRNTAEKDKEPHAEAIQQRREAAKSATLEDARLSSRL